MFNKMLLMFSLILSQQAMAASVRLHPCYEIAGQTGTSYAPSVAINERNKAVVMWGNADGQGNQVLVDVNCNKSLWGWLPSYTMARSPAPLLSLQCAMDASNGSHLVWVSESAPGAYQLHVGRRNVERNEAGEEGEPMFFDPSSYRFAWKPNGDFMMVRFLRKGSSKPKFTLQEYSPLSEGWVTIAPASKHHCVHQNIFLDQFAVAVDDQGKECVVWEEQVYPRTQVWFSQKVSDGGWSAPITVYTSPKRVYLSDVKVSMNAGSEVAVVWSSLSEAGTGCQVEGVVRNHAGEWGQSQTLFYAQHGVLNLNLLLDQEGNALCIWELPLEGGNQIMGVYRSHLQEWGEPMLLSALGAHHSAPKIQVTGSNEFVVVWEETQLDQCSIHARVFDGQSWSNDQVLALGKHPRQPAIAIAGSYGIIAWLKASSDGGWKVNYAHFGVY